MALRHLCALEALAEQPIGWNPDLNDGVRLNIRPFMTAEVLRHNKAQAQHHLGQGPG